MTQPNPLFARRVPLAAAALVSLAGLLAVHHAPADHGVSAEQITPDMVQTALAEAGDSARWMTGDYLVDFVEPADGEGGSEAAIAARVRELDAMPGVRAGSAGFYSEGEHLYRVSASPAAWDRIDDALGDDALVEGIEPEVYFALPQGLDEGAVAEPEPQKPPRADVDDPMFHYQWHMEQIHAPEAWTMGRGEGAIVAVIDTGVAWKTAAGVRQLPDLANTEFVVGESFISGLPEGLDDHAHGSHVAGTIAQSTNNGIGVTGVAYKAKIMPLKVLSKEGRGSVPGIANAIRYAADHGAHVINMSLGGPLPSKILAKAIAYAHAKGVTTVCAAGNEHRGRVGYPAANEFSVAVSSTNFDRDLAFYSNWGKNIDVAAPGGDTRSDRNGDGQPDGVLQNTIKIGRPLENDYLWFQGTSMASPHAAGVAALIAGEGITNPVEVERILKQTAVHPKGVAWDEYHGAGIVDARASIVEAKHAYETERGGLAVILGFMGLSGLGLAGLTLRRRVLALAGLLGGVAWGGGLFVSPLAYDLAGLLGLGTSIATFGSPLILSALLPLGLALLALGVRPARPLLLGLCLGYAALLLHGAIVLPTLLSGLPGGPGVDRVWLLANAGLALWLARRVSRVA